MSSMLPAHFHVPGPALPRDPSLLRNDALDRTPVQGAGGAGESDRASPELREAFDDFVGQAFYGQMLAAMRKTVGKPAYFHGGRAEEIFQNQLDQVLAERLADATASSFTGPMFDLFTLPRM